MSELFIHRFECPNCGQHAHADRFLPCFKCGAEMEQVEKVGEINV